MLLYLSVFGSGQIFSFGSLLVEYKNGAFEIHYDKIYLAVNYSIWVWSYFCLVQNDGIFEGYVDAVSLNTFDPFVRYDC